MSHIEVALYGIRPFSLNTGNVFAFYYQRLDLNQRPTPSKGVARPLSYSCNLLRCALPVASMALDHQNTTHLVSFTFLLLDRYFGFPDSSPVHPHNWIMPSHDCSNYNPNP